MTPERRRKLRAHALLYAGDLLCEVVNTYEAFENFEPDEQKYIDEYIVKLGKDLHARGIRATRRGRRFRVRAR